LTTIQVRKPVTPTICRDTSMLCGYMRMLGGRMRMRVSDFLTQCTKFELNTMLD